jgi:tetratricopeptide (TPR) repeat protein
MGATENLGWVCVCGARVEKATRCAFCGSEQVADAAALERHALAVLERAAGAAGLDAAARAELEALRASLGVPHDVHDTLLVRHAPERQRLPVSVSASDGLRGRPRLRVRNAGDRMLRNVVVRCAAGPRGLRQRSLATVRAGQEVVLLGPVEGGASKLEFTVTAEDMLGRVWQGYRGAWTDGGTGALWQDVALEPVGPSAVGAWVGTRTPLGDLEDDSGEALEEPRAAKETTPGRDASHATPSPDAAARLEAILAADPANAEACERLEALYVEREDYDHLLALYERAERATSGREERLRFARNCALIHEEHRDDPEGAARWWQRVISLAPDDAEAREALRRVAPARSASQAPPAAPAVAANARAPKVRGLTKVAGPVPVAVPSGAAGERSPAASEAAPATSAREARRSASKNEAGGKAPRKAEADDEASLQQAAFFIDLVEADGGGSLFPLGDAYPDTRVFDDDLEPPTSLSAQHWHNLREAEVRLRTLEVTMAGGRGERVPLYHRVKEALANIPEAQRRVAAKAVREVIVHRATNQMRLIVGVALALLTLIVLGASSRTHGWQIGRRFIWAMGLVSCGLGGLSLLQDGFRLAWRFRAPACFNEMLAQAPEAVWPARAMAWGLRALYASSFLVGIVVLSRLLTR